jgi:hypothetical protein
MVSVTLLQLCLCCRSTSAVASTGPAGAGVSDLGLEGTGCDVRSDVRLDVAAGFTLYGAAEERLLGDGGGCGWLARTGAYAGGTKPFEGLCPELGEGGSYESCHCIAKPSLDGDGALKFDVRWILEASEAAECFLLCDDSYECVGTYGGTVVWSGGGGVERWRLGWPAGASHSSDP